MTPHPERGAGPANWRGGAARGRRWYWRCGAGDFARVGGGAGICGCERAEAAAEALNAVAITFYVVSGVAAAVAGAGYLGTWPKWSRASATTKL